ncbi:MAG TPA: DUF1080 domain-containing protein [Arenibacter sp.]|nr:DUF1080 domain-containing protein [Arenibacter sp.]
MKIKNIFFVLCLACFACKAPLKLSNEQVEVISLFNGENLDKWRGDPRIWSVEDGCIVGRTSDENQIKKNTFLIYENVFSDFELSFNYKIIGGNSGVQYRAKVIDEDLFIVGGYQADMEAGTQHSGILYEEKGRGVLAKRGEVVIVDETGHKSVDQFANSESIQKHIKNERWNNYRIVAHGNHLQHFINDYKTIDVIDKEIGKKSALGIIALQVHKGPNMEVFYKDIKITERP